MFCGIIILRSIIRENALEKLFEKKINNKQRSLE
jgi:hypothetical protein